jgi:hypothetical protein
VAYFAYRVAGHLWPGDRLLLWGTPLLVSTIPQVVFVGSYHNPDAFTMAVTSASVFYGLKFLDDRGSRWVDALLFALSLGLATLAKLNGWLANGLFTGTVLLLSTGRMLRSKRLMAQWALVVLLPVFILSSWFLFQQWHYGDILARDVFRAAWSADRPLSVPLAQRGYDLLAFLLRTDWLKTSFKSFWAVFGYMSVYVHPAFYWALALLCLASGIGWMVRLVGRTDGVDLGSRQVRALRMFAFVVAGLAIAAAWTSLYQDYQPQGRYLFPVLIPICVLLLVGWRALLPSPRWQSVGLVALCVGMPLFDLICLFAYILPGMALQVRQEWFF